MPKNAGSQAIFDRSIVILTPRRALKFTATSRERHYIWLAALSYLSHSTPGLDDLANPQLLPELDHHYLPPHEPTTGLPWAPTHDSTGNVKVKARPSIGGHSYSSPIGLIEREMIEGVRLPWEYEEAGSDDAAEPPTVHRVAAHARKRSNSTDPRPGPLTAFYTYPNNVMAVASCCNLQGPTSRDKYDRYAPRLQVRSDVHLPQSALIRGIGESSNAPSPVVPDNFFDTAATVRMEAFVDGKDKEEVLSNRGRSYGERKKDTSFWGFDRSAARGEKGRAGLKGEDPFTEF